MNNQRTKLVRNTHLVKEEYYRKKIEYIKYTEDGEEETVTKTHNVTDRDNEDVVMVNCGKCTECLMSRAKDWATRLELETRYSETSYFATLTYNDANVPPKLKREDLNEFIKKLRNKDGTGIKLFASGEYGGKTHRPHFHICLFHVQPTELIPWRVRGEYPVYIAPEYEKLWGKGFVKVGTVTKQSAAYVARYTNKKAGGKGDEFITMSRRPGLGIQYYIDNDTKIWTLDSIVLSGGRVVTPPRYYEKLSERLYNDAYGDNLSELIKHQKEQRRHRAIIGNLNSYLEQGAVSEERKKRAELKAQQLIRILDYKDYEE